MSLQKQEFEIEHWPAYFGKHALLRLAKGFLKVYVVFGAAALISGALYFFLHIPFTGRIFQVAALGLVVVHFVPLISFFQRDRKHPSYGIRPDGFLLNERGWNSAFFKWEEIAWIKEFDHPKFGKELHFDFVDVAKALNKPNQKFQQSLSREYVIEKQPKKISGQLVKGEVSAFIAKFKAYYESYKSQQPMSRSEAFNAARKYQEQHYVTWPPKEELAEEKDSFTDANGKVWLFRIVDTRSYYVVEQDSKQVLGLWLEPGNWYKPHTYDIQLSKKDAIEYAKQYARLNGHTVKFTQDRCSLSHEGFEHIQEPVWIVPMEVENPRFEGDSTRDYIVSCRERKVVLVRSS